MFQIIKSHKEITHKEITHKEITSTFTNIKKRISSLKMAFDIGGTDGLNIFTNNDDMFNISTDIGPGFILDQGNEQGIADIGITHNVTSDVIADMPSEAPVDFINYDNNQAKSVADLNFGLERQQRKKMSSIASDVTIEAEPEPVKKKKSHSQSQPPPFPFPQQSFPQQSFNQFPQTFSQTFSQTTQPPPTRTPSSILHQDQSESPVDINPGFDDILDGKKLKPVNDILDDAASIGGESQETIRHGGIDDYSAPNSPNFRSFKPVAQSPPDSPLPSTIKEDRSRHKAERSGSSYQLPQDTIPQSIPQPVYNEIPEIPKYINEDDEKMDLLLKLKSLEERGKITLSKHYNIKSSIDDIRMEYRNQTGILEMQSSVNFMRKGLIFCTSGIEYMNRRFDPVGAKLDGWGESIMENMMDYDGIFERLHGKYKGSMEMEPEMELMFALMGSAFQFHLSQTFFKSAIPQLSEVLRENPNVMQGFMNVAQEAARRANPGMQGVPMGMPGVPTMGARMPMAANEMGVGGMVGGVPGNMQSPGIDFNALLGQVGITSGALSDFAKTMGNAPPLPQATREFNAPAVNDMYRQMVQQEHNRDNSDALSVSSETSDRSIGRRGTKAVITPIPTSRRGGGGNVIKLS